MKTRSLKKILERGASELNRLRRTNKGLVPLEVFPLMFDIGGAFGAVEVITRVRAKGSWKFALKKRAKGDHGWANTYHVVGTVVRKHDTPGQIYKRLADEVHMTRRTLESRIKFFSPTIMFIKPRNASCLSVVYLLDLTMKEFSAISGDWKLFRASEIQSGNVVDYQKTLLRNVAHKQHGLLLDLN